MIKRQGTLKPLLMVVMLSLPLLLQGCVSQGIKPAPGSNPASNANEALLQAVGNHSGLIALYRHRLAQTLDQAEQDELRLKLAQTYLNSGDTESALFYCQPVIAGAPTLKKECLLVKSRALLATGDHQQALTAAQASLVLDPKDPVILNQLGLVQADAGNYQEARKQFNQARMLMLDDVTARNNLAMVDILEQRWSRAADQLLPLFRNGQADDKVTANLLLALARSGRSNEFNVVCGRNDQSCRAYYTALATTGRRVNNG